MTDYFALFQRNVGVLTEEDLHTLRDSTIAIAGVGGVGGVQLATLARTGVGHFRVADPECYAVSDINRQYGATVSTLGLLKVEVMREIVGEINPEAEVRCFPDGITPQNVDAFVEGADLVIDAVEYCALDMKVLLARRTRENTLFLVTSPSWGYGASLVVFSPGGMTFEEFFSTETEEDFAAKGKRFAHRLFPLKPTYLDPYPYGDDMLEGKRPGSVLCLGTLVSAALVTTEVLAILLGKREPITAPQVVQVDLFRRSFDIVTEVSALPPCPVSSHTAAQERPE